MPLQMVALRRNKAGEWVARKSIPKNERDEYARLYGVRWEAILKLPANTSAPEAKANLGQWMAEIEIRIERIRAAARGAAQPLTALNALALAGHWYSWFVEHQQIDPRSPKHWSDRKDHFIWNILAPQAPEEHHEDNADPSWPWLALSSVRTAVAPSVREMALTASFLAHEGIALTQDADALFVAAVSDNLPRAYDLLEQRAWGDHSRDTTPETFPAYQYAQRTAADGLDCWDLFGAYVAAIKPADGTVSRWRAVFKDLQHTFTNRTADSLSVADAELWAGTLVTSKRSDVTVNAVWLPSANTVFRWAAHSQRKLIRANPFEKLKIDVRRDTVLRETKAFTAEEAQVILRAATAVNSTSAAFPRAMRWVMWICAYSGARSGEIAQLRGVDVSKRGDFYVLRLTPEAGSIKTSTARTVPIHEHLIEQGFIEFVRDHGSGPLFYNTRVSKNKTGVDLLNPQLSPALRTRARLGAWVRTLGVDDPDVGPTHGWRHSFKQIADRAGISERISDTITGHAPVTTGRAYGKATVEDMAEALKKFPRYIL